MGTSCYIGIEEANGSVEYIYNHFDGYFENIVPILRDYTEREDVKKMITSGGLVSLSELRMNTPHNVREPPCRISSMYNLMDAKPRVAYVYVFTRDNEWVCDVTLPFFSMKELKYYDKK